MLCVPLLLIKPLSFWFFAVYIICGASDVLDGYIARKTNSTSKFGSVFDSVADFLLVGILLIVFMPVIIIPQWILFWIFGIAVIKITALTIGYLRYHTFSFLHTYTNKTTGFVLFCAPLSLYFFDITIIGCFICVIASLSAFEELIIIITSKELVRDVKSIFVLH